jgi:hypothetical protein
MKAVTRHDVELIETVQAHLKNLASLSTHNADAPTIRIATAALRALVSEEMLQRAWGASGLRGPVTFKTYFIAATCGDDVIAYCGGGDILPGIPFSVSRSATLEERVLNLKDFSRQTRIKIGAETASTTDIIKYVANALGGTHYDPGGKAAHKYDLLRRIEANEVGQLFLEVNNRNPLYHEILSIAQAVILSPQVKELMEWSAPKSGKGSA